MAVIRKAEKNDLSRMAEIFVFAKRVHYRPIFRNDAVCFGKLQVLPVAAMLSQRLDTLWVYEDTFLWGFIGLEDGEIKQLFVDPLLEGRGVGGKLLAFGIREGGRYLWALEKNARALALYQKYGFAPTGERSPVEDTGEYAIQLCLNRKRNGEDEVQ